VTAVGGTSLTKDSTVPRGWSESAWVGTGSGCSAFETKPIWQKDTGCANRTTTDVSAVADPSTGVALYDSYSQSGWLVAGGTSVSSPIIASSYALAGTPVAGTYPSSYPYLHSAALNDVVSGYNGFCTPAYLCTAGPGYDGPTGLGTPKGVAAFTGSFGHLAGQVTNAANSSPISGVMLSTATGYTATSDSAGHYDMVVPVGSYQVTARLFGYKGVTQTGVVVTKGQTTTTNFALTSVPSSILSGTVTDGSGHAWPLYATITVDYPGYPGGAVYTNPYTGHYSVSLPQQNTYTLHLAPVYIPGYATTTQQVTIGTAAQHQNLAVTVDQTICATPGYAYTTNGAYEQFTGWTGTTPQDGWTSVSSDPNNTWGFGTSTPPPGLGTPPGAVGEFAFASDQLPSLTMDTSLVSSIVDLSTVASPEIGFDTYYYDYGIANATADVDLSVDGGQTWANLWHQDINPAVGHVDISIPQAAGHAQVEVRFHFTAPGTYSTAPTWALDNVLIGSRPCDPTPGGGLVAGIVTDHNTRTPIDGATVTSTDNPSEFAVSAATPNDPNLTHGFYWLFSSLTGGHPFTAVDGRYTGARATVNVAANSVTRQDWTLTSGLLTATPGSISVTQALGASSTAKVTFTNTGTVPVHTTLAEQDAPFTPLSAQQTGAALQLIKGHFSPAIIGAGNSGTAPTGGTQLPTPYDAPWTNVTDYPIPIWDNAVGYNDGDGKVYSFAGATNLPNDYFTHITGAAYAYDPVGQQWSPIAAVPQALALPAGAFIDGKMYLAGGATFNATTQTYSLSAATYAYDPSSNSWAQLANMPTPIAASAAAALDGQLYIVGGCTTLACPPTSASVYRYDPSNNSWTQIASYPAALADLGCAGITGEIVCAGGTNASSGSVPSSSTYIYHASTNTWSQGANMPYGDWGMASGGANGKLQIVGGVTPAALTNQASEYDPASNTWIALPNANNAEYRGGGSCGLYEIGGSNGSSGVAPNQLAQVLPGYEQCGSPVNVPWLAESTTGFDVPPGQSVTVTVTMNAATVAQPGTYAARLVVGTNAPSQVQPITITMHVNAPRTWGKIAGTVTDAATGRPIPGATIQIGTNCHGYQCGPVSFTLKTDSNGYYQLWLNQGYDPLQVIAARDGYQQQVTVATITKGNTTTLNFQLKTG
jgi:N-acetylneuraminic acid mutarotase